MGTFALIIATAGTAMDSDSVAPEFVAIPWGDPALADGDMMTVIGPTWCLGAKKAGGTWGRADSSLPLSGWIVSGSETNDASLLISLDRQQLGSDLRMDVTLVGSTNLSLAVELLGESGDVVGAIPSEEFGADVAVAVMKTLLLPLQRFPQAGGVRIRRERGSVVIYNTTLTRISALGWAEPLQGTAVGGDGLQYHSLTGAVFEVDAVGVHATRAVADETLAPESLAAVLTNTLDQADSAWARTGTNQQMGASVSRGVVYVNAALGRDTFTGLDAAAPMATGARIASTATNAIANDGPKATIRAGLSVAGGQGAVVIQGGIYREDVELTGGAVAVRIAGDVRIMGSPSILAPLVTSGTQTNGAQLAKKDAS